MQRIVLYSLFFLISLAGFPQTYRFKHITTDDGLPTNYVQCLLRDRQGFMWFGTQTGLSKYDGYNIITYKNNIADKKSIASSDILCLYEHTDGKIYIGTRNAGLCIYNPVDKSFERIPLNGGKDATLTDARVTCVHPDSDENLWVGTGNGVTLFSTKSRKCTQLFFPGSDAVPVYCIYKFNGNVLVGTSENGLWEIEKDMKLVQRVLVPGESVKPDLTKLNTVCRISDYAGKLYMATQGEGFLVVDPNSFEIEKIKKASAADLPVNYLKDLVIKNNKAYSNTKTGFVIYHLLSDKVEVIEKSDDKTSLNDNDITCFLIDKSGDIWLGTFAGGVNVFFSQTQRFPNLRSDLIPEFTQTYSIFESRDGKLWVGGEQKLKTYNSKTQQVEDLSRVVGSNYVLSLEEDNRNNMYIGTWGRGIIRYNKASGDQQDVLPAIFGHLDVLSQHIDNRGQLWIGAFGEGLYIFDPAANAYKKVKLGGGYHENVTSIAEDSEKNFWICTAGDGVFMLSGSNPAAAPVNLRFSDSTNSIASNTVYHMYEDANRNKWFATDNGLSRYDMAAKKFVNYREEDGLADNYLYSVLPDSAGNLWMSSNKGITRFNPKVVNKHGSAFRNYDRKDGLLNNEYVQGAFCRRANGELAFGSTNGINIFNPRKILDNFQAPPVYIVSYKRAGKDVLTDTAISSKKYLTLTWRENFFQFEVAALDYNDPSKNKYMYMLEGYDADWSEPTSVRYVSYTELPGGEYVFKVKASNNDGVWNEVPYYIYIRVVPPFWKTLWFYILVSVLGVAGIIVFTQYRTRAIKKENKVLEHKVAERTKELAEKNRDITSSIEYARRIQEAILPSKDFIFSKFENAFILYKPKDIVSGDFYWFGLKNRHRIFAVVDCTGHGVPGAFMSMIGHNLLNQIVIEKEVTDPGEILNQLHTGVQNALKQGRGEVNTNDGMDVSLLVVNEETHEVKWAGAFRPMVIVRANGTLDRLSGDKFPVGGAQLDSARVFTTVRVEMGKGDTSYLFSDGYADQFGGDKGKKYMVKNFHELLGSIRDRPLEEQRQILEKTFEQWRGSHEQVDDVLVVGIRF